MPSPAATARRERPDRQRDAREVRHRPRYVVAEDAPAEADPKAAEAVLDWLASLLR